MGDKTKIQWTDATWPVVAGCTKISSGCDNCYAIRDSQRLGGNPNAKVQAAYGGTTKTVNGRPNWSGVVRPLPERLDWPLRWRKPRRIFVCNESDLFHEAVEINFIGRVFRRMAQCPRHTFQILTKRPERCLQLLGDLDFHAGYQLSTWPMLNVWLGVSVEDQTTADERIPLLLQTPAAVRFVSYEPALGPVDFEKYIWPTCIDPKGQHNPESCDERSLDWIIAGGESGPKARPFNLQWARSSIAQCKAAGVPCFVKQLGANIYDMPTPALSVGVPKLKDRKGGDVSEWPEDLRVREFPGGEQ